jgi:hypothetical protein
VLICYFQITAVKAYVDGQTQQTPSRLPEAEVPALLAAGPRPATKSDMLASMPSKALADKFIVRFFETYDPALPGACMGDLLHLITNKY